MATKKDRPSNINVPNALTLLRVIAVPVFGWMLLAHAREGGWRTATTIVFMVAILIVGAGQGAYVAVDVALMTEVLPTFEEAGKDLGIVALAYQLPQLLAPMLAIPVLAIGGGQNYSALFVCSIVLSLLGGLAILGVRGVR